MLKHLTLLLAVVATTQFNSINCDDTNDDTNIPKPSNLFAFLCKHVFVGLVSNESSSKSEQSQDIRKPVTSEPLQNRIIYDNYAIPMSSNDINLEQIEKDYNDTMESVIPSSQTRFLSHIQTDKVVYRPGDIMFIQAYIFDALNKTPAYSSNLRSYSQQTLAAQRSFPRNYAETYVYLTMTIINPLGEAIFSTSAQMSNSTVSFTYIIPDDLAGGEYQIRTTGSSIPESIRVIRIRQYERQELNIQAQFNASSYKPGDYANATILIRPADGSTFQNGQYPSYAVVVTFENGTQFIQELQQTDENGQGYTSFQIPEDYSLGYVSVQITAFYRNIIQGYTQTLTIVQVQNIYVQFFPETFNYVYNVPNKVYFQAYASNDTNGEYVDIQDAMLVYETGITYDENGFPISATGIEAIGISTYHEGRGNFTFIPMRGWTYYLEFSQGGVSNRQYLNVSEQPDINNLELNFGIDHKVLESYEDLNVILQTNNVLDSRDLYVIGVFNKEDIIYLQEYRFSPNQSYLINIPANDFDLRNGGVLRVAVFKVINALVWYDRYDVNVRNISTRTLLPNPWFDIYFIPKGEFLFFKKPADKLLVSLSVAPNTVYQPGDYVEFDVQVNDAFTSAAVGFDRLNPTLRSFISVTVTDESVFYQVENRKQPPSLPAMVYLEKEIQLQDNQFFNSQDYIDYIYQQQSETIDEEQQAFIVGTQNAPNEYVSNRNTDLLLGVQGWRYGYFYPQVMEEWPQVISRMNATDRRQLQNLMAYTFDQYTYYNVRSRGATLQEGVNANGFIAFSRAADMEAAPMPPAVGSGAGETTGEGEAQAQDQNGQAQLSSSLARRELEFWNFLRKYLYCDFPQNTRYYSHAQRFSFFNEQASRFDTTETVFYQAAVMTDRLGTYRVRFYLSDLITQFRITATAFDTTGRMGYTRSVLISRSNFYISFQLPQQLTLGDSLLIPVYINNNFNQTVTANLEINTFDNNLTATFEQNNQTNSEITIGPNEQAVVYMRVTANSIIDNVNIQVRATTLDPYTNDLVVDAIFRDTVIVSPGVEQSQSQSGLVGPNQPANFVADLPETMVSGTQSLIAEVYQSDIDALVRSLISIITGTPGPCFICIFNPLYANLLVLRAAQSATNPDIVDQSAIQTQATNLNNQLQQYVGSNGGVYQFVGSQQDPFLSTLYLLYQSYASQILGVSNVNSRQVADYLLSLRSATGTFDRLVIPYQPYSNYVVEAFIVYALTSVGIVAELQDEIARLTQILNDQMNTRDANTLFIGVMANIYLNVNNTSEAEQLLDFLASRQLQDGSIQQVITIDTPPERLANNQFDSTAAAVLGWQSNTEKYGRNIAYGINYLIENLRYRYYGSSIGVILSFNALLNYLRDVNAINGSGEFVLDVNNNEIDRQYFSSEDNRIIQFNTDQVRSLNSDFAPGNQVDIEIYVDNFIADEDTVTSTDQTAEDANQVNITIDQDDSFLVQYYMQVSYDDTNPTTSPESDLRLTVEQAFNESTLGSQQTQGQLFTYRISIQNLQENSTAGLTILEFRPASCLQVNFAQLETLKLNRVISEYQALDNNSVIVLYIEGLDANQTLTFQLDFLQAFQGECRQRPIDVYEYYNPNNKYWVTFE